MYRCTICRALFLVAILSTLPFISERQSIAATNTSDTSAHKTLYVKTSDGVRLEVLDWGGSGSPLVFLTGWGNDAHVFDNFAPKFLGHHHVYAITRRGFGNSDKPAPTVENYDSDRLADDVLDVIASLKLERPILAGHSVAGQEMSSIGSRHPEKVAALIYLEAAYAFAYYSPNGGYTVQVEADTVRRDLLALMDADSDPQAASGLIAKIRGELPHLDHALVRAQANIDGAPEPKPRPPTAQDLETNAMLAGRHMYRTTTVPTLAIIAAPYHCTANCDRADQIAWAQEIEAQADAYEAGNLSAHVVRIPNADHYIFRSNEAQAEQEMNTFMDSLR
jgi:non-heme chloroperoxidase